MAHRLGLLFALLTFCPFQFQLTAQQTPDPWADQKRFYNEQAETARQLEEAGRNIQADCAGYLSKIRQGKDYEYGLAILYEKGWCFPQDYGTAAEWYRRGAERGHLLSMQVMALDYFQGKIVPQDFVEAHMWANLVVLRLSLSQDLTEGDRTKNRNLAVAFREQIAAKMTREQVAQAQAMARNWRPRTGAGDAEFATLNWPLSIL